MKRGEKTKEDHEWLFQSILFLITGHPKKSVSRTVHLFFVWLYCCFIQTWCINNDWKCDFWHPRCLFYQVESILFHLQQLQKKNFPKIPMKYSKNGQKFTMSENTSNVLFGTCWTPCKKPHVSTWSRSRYTFFWMTRYPGTTGFYLLFYFYFCTAWS